MAITSFSCRETENLFNTNTTTKFTSIHSVATRKLAMLNAAVQLKDLKSPPGNKLHPLTKDRAGQYSISINDQFRICFEWTDAGPSNVEITDYH
jgi:proteic killer suppression protein